MSEKKREFVDKKRELMGDYYDLLDNLEDMELEDVKKTLRAMIKKDPDYLDPYLLLFEILLNEGNIFEADELLDEAYARALKLISDEKGQWPDSLEWGYLQNRHVSRALLTKAIILWGDQFVEDALAIFRNLLACNPSDNVGARFYILAIRSGMGFDEFDERFNKGGYYDDEILVWFDENHKKFPDEFEKWEAEIRRRGYA